MKARINYGETIDLDNISYVKFESMLERLHAGKPLKLKETRVRDKNKRIALRKFFIDTTPTPEDILSGKCLSEVIQKFLAASLCCKQ